MPSKSPYKLTPESAASQGVHFLPQEEYDRLVGHIRLQLNGVFLPFHGYGNDVFIPEAINAIVDIMEDFGLNVRGVKKPMRNRVSRAGNGFGKSVIE